MTEHTVEYAAFQRGENNEALCPIPGCGAALYLTFADCVPLYAVDPPWPGGKGGYAASDAVSSAWEVECVDGHKVWTHVDQIAADNAAGLTEDDLTGDTAPPFRMEALNTAFSPATKAEPEVCGRCEDGCVHGTTTPCPHCHGRLVILPGQGGAP